MNDRATRRTGDPPPRAPMVDPERHGASADSLWMEGRIPEPDRSLALRLAVAPALLGAEVTEEALGIVDSIELD